MMRSLFSAISGLQVHQTMLDVAANDIANVNTVGFKGERTSLQGRALAAPARRQRPVDRPRRHERRCRSASASSSARSRTRWARARSSRPATRSTWRSRATASSASRDGAGGGFGAGYNYTRAGNFTTDSSGNLVTQDGKFVLGYAAATRARRRRAGTDDRRSRSRPRPSRSRSARTASSATSTDDRRRRRSSRRSRMAKFPNDAGLAAASGDNASSSRTTRAPRSSACRATRTGIGTLAAGALEMSNVDLAQEFTNMITAQRGFQANSRVISTADQMLQDLVNLGRSSR